MTDIVLKLKDIEDFFQEITCEMLGIDLSKKENQSKVRIAWPTGGAPGWKINDAMTRQLNICYDPVKNDEPYVKKQVGYTRVHKINWTLYGPNSYDNADIIRHMIFDFDYMKKFKEKNLFLITDVPMPTRLPEYYNGQWWERTDFSATFNEGVTRESEVPYIKNAEIILKHNR